MKYLLFVFAVMMFIGCAMNDPYNRTMPKSTSDHHDSDGGHHHNSGGEHHDKR